MSDGSYGYHVSNPTITSSERISGCAKMNTTELKQATQFLHEKGTILAPSTL